MQNLITQHKPEFEKAMNHFGHELATVRTGRANPALLSTVQVEQYGSRMQLEHVASITVADARTLVISPWDKSLLGEIDKAINAANLGLNPSNDGQVLRITLPALTEDRRKEMVRLINQMSESARVGVRQVRETILKAGKKAEAEGELTKDDLAGLQKQLQEVVDTYNEEIKTLAEHKEKELMTI